uniref:Uncharacterized protein n=1 Tax=Setaria digitata TaxID=48799 RepID=A0A915PYX4_9BILA
MLKLPDLAEVRSFDDSIAVVLTSENIFLKSFVLETAKSVLDEFRSHNLQKFPIPVIGAGILKGYASQMQFQQSQWYVFEPTALEPVAGIMEIR